MRANTTPRGGSVASTAPKGSKFSAIRNLPAAEVSATSSAAAAPSSARSQPRGPSVDGDWRAVSDTVRQVQDHQRAEEDEGETEARIRRHRYAQLVARLSSQRSQYYSTGVFVEAMLKEAQHAAGGNAATVAAVATWGLRILARESRSDALTAVMNALLPALYCQYIPGEVCSAPPAVQLQVRERDVLEDNPYFTHAMFVDEAQSGKQSTGELRQALEAAVKANDERRSVIMRFIDRQQQMRLSVVFRSWRNTIRQNRIIQLISKNRAKREGEETALLRKQAVFYQWKLVVERSRTAYLTERLHDAAFQLENAKNQFQLQCYRADRLVQAAKDATSELAQVSEVNAELTQEVEQLKEERISREREFNRLLTRSVTRLLRLLGTYDELARVFVQSRQAAVQGSVAAASKALGSDVRAEGDTAGKTAEGGSSSAGKSPLDPPQGADAALEASADVSLQRLRQWVNAVLAGVKGREGPFRPLGAFGPDFADGERYLYLLQQVFPDIISSVLAVPTMGVETRLRRIRDYAVQCKLRYLLLPSDFLNEREDLLVCSLGELYQRDMLRQWKHATLESAAGLDAFREYALAETAGACAETPPASLTALARDDENAEEAEEDASLLDSATVSATIADYLQRLQRVSEELDTAVTTEIDAADGCIAVAEGEARLGSERLQGMPIPLVEEARRRVFWDVAPNALNDLREEPQLALEARMWDFAVTQSLPAVLRDAVDVTSRIFYFFAGENAKTLSEVAFWRFVEVSGLLVSPVDVSKQWIVTQYDRVVSPQLDAALKAAARNQSEMSLQKLREVAYQEMDIRTATPLQFVELLVRLAVACENGEYGLVEGTRRLVRRLQLPSRERMTAMEREMATPETQNVLRYFNEDLFRTFLFYVKQQESSRNAQERAMATQDGGRFSAQMSVITLLTFLDDCRYLSDGNERGTAPAVTADGVRARFFVATAQIRKLVPALERQCKVPPTGYLSFSLFVDLLAALACHWCPDPLVPSSRRLAAFLAFTIQQLNARHVNSTLLLGNAPTISLDGGKAVDFSHEARPMSGSRTKLNR